SGVAERHAGGQKVQSGESAAGRLKMSRSRSAPVPEGRSMKPRLFTPRPTPVPEETLLELAKPVTYHRAPEAKAILAEVSEDLKYVYQTANPVFTITASGTGGMEAAV